MDEHTDEAPKSGKDKPLISATPTGAAIIGIPIASIMAGIGWAGQKLLLIDETQHTMRENITTIQERQAIHENQIIETGERINGVEQRIVRNEEELDSRGTRFDNAAALLATMSNDVIRNHTLILDTREEQLRIRAKVDDIKVLDLRWLEDRVQLMEQRQWNGKEK